jgi:hypothetical protein
MSRPRNQTGYEPAAPLTTAIAAADAPTGGKSSAARIPLRCTIDNPGMFETIVSVLRNSFVSVFARSLEGSIWTQHATHFALDHF